MYADRSMEVEEMVKAPLEKTENDDLERRGFSGPMERFCWLLSEVTYPKTVQRCRKMSRNGDLAPQSWDVTGKNGDLSSYTHVFPPSDCSI